MYIDQLKKQHTEIARLTKELQQYTDAAAVTSKAAAIASTLSKLSGVLSVHLAAEDKYLYPSSAKANTRRSAAPPRHSLPTWAHWRQSIRTTSSASSPQAGLPLPRTRS